jgi:SM-20-related protein
MNISTVDLEPIAPLLDAVVKTYVDRGLSYGWPANPKKDYDFGHWNNTILQSSRSVGFDHSKLPYIDNHPIIKQIWDEVQRIIGDRTLVRAYVNGYTYGTDAYFHKDDDWIQREFGEDSISETVLIYLNQEDWDRDWGGETAIVDENDNFLASVFPKRNRALIFDSNLWHSARSLNRCCPHLRSVLVFKTAGPQYNRPWVEWIKEKTEGIPHSGTDLFYHLYNTAMTIDSMRGVPYHIVKAGLYHSVYGTAYFDPELNVTREEVREQIGEKAEELAHIFCTLENRYESIMNNSGGWNNETQFGLLLIELANMLEMLERKPQNAGHNDRIAALDAKIASFKIDYPDEDSL